MTAGAGISTSVFKGFDDTLKHRTKMETRREIAEPRVHVLVDFDQSCSTPLVSGYEHAKCVLLSFSLQVLECKRVQALHTQPWYRVYRRVIYLCRECCRDGDIVRPALYCNQQRSNPH
jgi:hypothetical protein